MRKPKKIAIYGVLSCRYLIGPGNILTVADDLLKNDGQKFLEMMEELAERRMQREEEAAADVEDDSEDDSEDDGEDGSDVGDDDDVDGGSEDEDDEEDEDEEVGGVFFFLISFFSLPSMCWHARVFPLYACLYWEMSGLSYVWEVADPNARTLALFNLSFYTLVLRFRVKNVGC